MDYYKYKFSTEVVENEALMAMVSLLPFDTFVEKETGFDAFLPAADFDESIEKDLATLQNNFKFEFEKEFIKGQNWNQVWESKFQPIQVQDFCGIRAGFHEPMKGVVHELIITPKMAFGTGHHETTFMMIQLMRELTFKNQRVFDYGCGTGVLAILASKLGADSIDAIDIEETAWQNTIENSVTNNVTNVNAYKGQIDLVKGKQYGIVLANINRNVILDSLDSLSNKLSQGGTILFSGILKSDRELMLNALNKHGFECNKLIEKNKWIAMQCNLK